MIKIALLVLFLLIIPATVIGDCTCDPGDEDHNKSLALNYKIGAVFSILLAGAIGVGIPILGKVIPALQPEKDIFFIVKAFAAGVILSTAFIHVLPDAFDSLTSPCLNENPWGKFPFTGFVAMVAAIGTLMIDCFATYYYSNLMRKKEVNVSEETGDEEESKGEVHRHRTNGHSHGRMLDDSASSQLLRHRVIAQVLELGIVAHSLIIGISMGASQSPKTIKPLMAALTFHQFFEGMGLGGCISQAKFKGRAMLIMGLFFSLTTPLGIAIGIGISEGYNENSPTALIIQGIFDAASAGILIYMSLVDLLAADFMHPKVQSSGKLQFEVNLFLLFGAGCMSILAIWA